MLGQLKTLQPNADYDHMTLRRTFNGGLDFADVLRQPQHPELVSKIITLRQSARSICASRQVKITVVPSPGPDFKTDPACCRTGAAKPTVSTSSNQVPHTDMTTVARMRLR